MKNKSTHLGNVTIWVQLSGNKVVLATSDRAITSETHSLSSTDVAKIRKDAELAIENDMISSGDTMFRISKSNTQTINSWLNKREDLTTEEKEAFLEYIDEFEPAKQLATAKWFTAGVIRLPEDQSKVDQAIKVAKVAKVDPMQYKSPMELINAHSDISVKGGRINPDNVATLSNKVEYEDGVVVYNVEDSKQGQNRLFSVKVV